MQNKFEGKTMVFRKDFNDRAFYSTTIGKKKQDGTYDNGYINLQFKKGVEMGDRTTIDIKNGWLTFYLKEKTPVWQIFVSEFEVLASPNAIPEGFMALDDDCPF